MLSHALHASFADASEQRASDRRILRLEAQAAMPAGEGGIQIHNLSRTGMLAECAADVAVGTAIEVELPGGARHHAEVVWRDAELFGCRFARPLSQATLSAALLRAAPLSSTAQGSVPALNPALARLREHWTPESEAASATLSDWPLGKRLWAVIGMGVVAWMLPGAILAVIL